MNKLFQVFGVDKYYKMSNSELEQEASKYKIGEYVESTGERTVVRRRLIIEQLLAKDLSNNSRVAIFISLFALVISIISIIVSLLVGGSQ